MRVAVLSDIHANCFAFDAALADLRQQSFDQIVCLGDAIQGGAQPKETVERLRKLGCPIVMGNADAWLLDEENDRDESASPQQREGREWTLSKLSAEDLELLRSFQPTLEIRLEAGQRLLCFHGSPRSYHDLLLPDTPETEWQRLLGSFTPAVMAGGHSHTQQVRRIGEGLFFNPGSIGVAYNYYLPENQFHTDPWAEYAILTCHEQRMSLSFHRVPYNVKELIEIIEASGRPYANALIADYERVRRDNRA